MFLGRNVPVDTHRAALRRLWRLDPFYNRLDGLSDYCEDFTDRANVVSSLRTAYQVGRGFLEQDRDTESEADPTPPEAATPVADRPVATPADPAPPKPCEPARAAGCGAPQSGREELKHESLRF